MTKAEVSEYLNEQREALKRGDLSSEQIFILELNFPGWDSERSEFVGESLTGNANCDR